ncbi:hypothetical protein Pcinc_025997 [Petrolisthes cinctipes]|uniref:Uncharacterized protein n=1 Tax=Petrolisthes cinctipes TaxID=88211 RepID=A0AAE1F6X2_PETCI|nr:hypothetical protein Pcinc_025997 [Petrolisthes cinctipes]
MTEEYPSDEDVYISITKWVGAVGGGLREEVSEESREGMREKVSSQHAGESGHSSVHPSTSDTYLRLR